MEKLYQWNGLRGPCRITRYYIIVYNIYARQLLFSLEQINALLARLLFAFISIQLLHSRRNTVSTLLPWANWNGIWPVYTENNYITLKWN